MLLLFTILASIINSLWRDERSGASRGMLAAWPPHGNSVADCNGDEEFGPGNGEIKWMG